MDAERKRWDALIGRIYETALSPGPRGKGWLV